MAFSIAGSMAFKDAMKKADPVIMEPIMKVDVVVPDEYMGNVIGDLNSRRGAIQNQESTDGTARVTAMVPLSEMFGYATDLRSKTQGRGQYSMEPADYQQVPKSVADKIMTERNCFGQIFIQVKCSGYRSGILGNFKSMCQTGSVMITFRC